MNSQPDYFDGFYRCTFTKKNSQGVPLHLLETSGIIIPGTDAVLPPLKFYDAQRMVWQRPASLVEEFDFGSVPETFQSVVSPLKFSRAYAMHDPAYVNHGWWESSEKNGIYVFCRKSRHEVDHMLIRWMLADGSSEGEAYAAFEGVKYAGGAVWRRHVGPFPAGPFIQGESVS